MQQQMQDDHSQEEAWDREGMLDPAWERQQRKVSLTLLILCGNQARNFCKLAIFCSILQANVNSAAFTSLMG